MEIESIHGLTAGVIPPWAFDEGASLDFARMPLRL